MCIYIYIVYIYPPNTGMFTQGALQYRLTRTGRRCVRGGARSCVVRQTMVLKRGYVYWSCIVRHPCITVRPCIEFPLYCSAPCTGACIINALMEPDTLTSFGKTARNLTTTPHGQKHQKVFFSRGYDNKLGSHYVDVPA